MHYNASLEFVVSVREFHVYGAQPSDAWKLVFANNTRLQFGRVRLVPDISHTHEHTVRKDAGNVSWKWDFCIHDANFARSICL